MGISPESFRGRPPGATVGLCSERRARGGYQISNREKFDYIGRRQGRRDLPAKHANRGERTRVPGPAVSAVPAMLADGARHLARAPAVRRATGAFTPQGPGLIMEETFVGLRH